ncbi:MAG TPA: hypothetical protein VF913_20170 [Xanthobacteraceae bacterium]
MTVFERTEADDVLTATVTVTRHDQLAVALKQRAKPVIIENDALSRQLIRLEYWRDAKWWLIAWLVYRLLASAMAHQYHLEADWHVHWKTIEASGRLLLTPYGSAATPRF